MSCDKSELGYAGNIQSLWIFVHVFSREHEPIHVHVVGKDGMAKYVWDGNEFVFYERRGIKAQDLKRIGMMIEENSDIIIRHWNKYFGKEADNEDYENMV